jgi:hypothetical protein
MWWAGNCFQEVFGCRALSFWGVPVLEFVMGSVLGGAYSVGMRIPVENVVHGCAVSQEDAIKSIRVQSRAALSGFLGRDAQSKCEKAIKSWPLFRICLVWGDVQA